MGISDAIGQRGEWICHLRLTTLIDEAPLFRPVFLGDKWPAVDLLVELVAPTPKGRRGMFCAQIKSTRQGYQPNGRLKIPALALEKVEALAAYPLPRYVLGVDEPGERVYIIAAQGTLAGMSSMSQAHELTRERLVCLHREVQMHCDAQAPLGRWSEFQEAHWESTP